MATGQSADTYTEAASARAYIQAVNRLIVRREKSAWTEMYERFRIPIRRDFEPAKGSDFRGPFLWNGSLSYATSGHSRQLALRTKVRTKSGLSFC